MEPIPFPLLSHTFPYSVAAEKIIPVTSIKIVDVYKR